MRKRLFSMLLALCMVLTLIPSVAFADGDTRYGVWIEGEEITSSRKWSRSGWEFDPDTYTLTLRNFQIGTIGTKISALFDKYSLFGLIYVDTSVDDLTICLEGDKNYLGDEAFPYENCTKYKEAYYGICATGTNLTITGNRGAILKIQTHENAIECKKLTIKDSVTVEAVSQGTCIYAGGDITIEGVGTIVNARTTDIIQGQAAVSTRGKLYVGESSRLITCSVAKSSSWERVGFYPNYPDTNYISSLYVAGVATVDGGIVTAYFYKRSGSYINEYDYSIEDYGETKAFYCKRLEINNGGEVDVFFERAEGKDPQNEYGFDTNDFADSWEDLWRGCIYFQGDGVMRVGMTNGNREENAISMKNNRMVIAGPHVKLSRTNCPPQIYSKYSDYVELTGKKQNSITLFMQQGGGRLNPWWSYYTDKTDATYIGGTLALKDIVSSDLELKLTAEPGTYTVDPMVNEGCTIPEMVVQSGATLKLTMQQWENYAFTKPIWLEGGSLEIDGTTASITGLDVRGTGTVTFNGGTVSGTVEKSVQVVINGGNIDIPDYDNAVDGNGSAVHKFVYTVETEERYTQPLQIKTMTGPDEYDTVSLSSGPFHRGENNERLLYLWLDRSDRVLRLRVNDPNENKHKDCLALRFGTNVFTEGPHLNMRSSGAVVAREGERLTLSAIENQTPTDMQDQYVKEVLWLLSTDGGQTFQQIRCSYGNMGGVSYDYTIPSVTKDQNGYIYRAQVTYRNGEDVWGGTMETYTYEATIYMDQPELRAPESYVVGQTAKFEVVHPTLPEGITMKYFWQTSKDGESWDEIPSIFGECSTYEPVITADMEGMQVRAVVQTWKNYSRVATTILGPVTIDTIGMAPRITLQPKDAHGYEQEDISLEPGSDEDGNITIIIRSFAVFRVAAEGENLHYQWQVSKDSGRTYTDIANSDDPQYFGPFFEEANDGWLYRCIVSNEYGATVSESGCMISDYPPKFTSDPTNKTAKTGQGTYFEARFKQGVPYGADVTWQVSTDGGKKFRDVVETEDGVTLVMERSTEKDGVLTSEWYTSFTLSNVTKDMDGYRYRCVIKNKPNDRNYNGIRYSAAVTLTVTRNCAVEGHELDEGMVTTAPTCTATGVKTFTCSACGGTEVTILPALEHDWAAATCTSPKTCRRDGCSATDGLVDQANHTGEKKWVSSERQHTQRYSCCGLVTVETEDHTWEKGVCALCDYHCVDHSGGTATCAAKAVCEICNQEYGELGSHTYAADWSSDSQQHWHDCNLCDSRADVGAHADENKDHKCDVCGQTISAHTGGTATCVKKAVCNICGEEYGELGGHVYAADWSSDSQQHWHDCTLCDSRADVGAHADENKDHKCDTCGQVLTAHAGGEATCVKKAVCEECGEAYGDVDSGNHENLVRVPAVEATKDADGNIEYWYCDACGGYFTDAGGKDQIAKADTVTAKLPAAPAGEDGRPGNGDSDQPGTGDSGAWLWMALFFTSGGSAIAAAAANRRKKRGR